MVKRKHSKLLVLSHCLKQFWPVGWSPEYILNNTMTINQRPPYSHIIRTCMLTSSVTLLYLVTCTMTILSLTHFWPVFWCWPECWPPVWYCCILWPAPWPPITHTVLTCILTSWVTFWYLVTCSMTPNVDSDLHVDLLCDIVVSCDLLHDPPITHTVFIYMSILTCILTSCVTLLYLVTCSMSPY